MAIPEFVSNELGHSARCLFRANYLGSIGTNRVEVDPMGLAPVQFIDSDYPESNPLQSYATKGLKNDGVRLSVARPAGAPTSEAIGNWATIFTNGIPRFPDDFMFAGSFRSPRQVPGEAFAPGNYAACALLNVLGVAQGATCQFRPQGVRLNLGGMGLNVNRSSIDADLASRIFQREDPATIGLAISVKLSTPRGNNSRAFLYVGRRLADSVSFKFPGLTRSTPIADLRAGLGTASGEDYRASLRLLGFQFWVVPQLNR